MIQIDMPMPKNCCDCHFASADLINGIITLSCMTPTGRRMYAPGLINEKDRPEWCPLKEHEAVVRCKYCEHCYFASNRIPSEQNYACGKHGFDVAPDWFCADGERKEGR